MAKAQKPRRYRDSQAQARPKPPAPAPPAARRLPAVAEFPYGRFAKLAAKMPFTQKEWAAILHLSEKTLQRYAKDNRSFEGIYVDRILQLEQLVDLGLDTFSDAAAFYQWLKKEKKVLGQVLTFESLYSTQGIMDLADQLGRIQQGVYT
jgi:uncharacterized protein (DUF2384 family)